MRSTFPKSSRPPKSPEMAGLQVSILYRLTSEYLNHDLVVHYKCIFYHQCLRLTICDDVAWWEILAFNVYIDFALSNLRLFKFVYQNIEEKKTVN